MLNKKDRLKFDIRTMEEIKRIIELYDKGIYDGVDEALVYINRVIDNWFKIIQ